MKAKVKFLQSPTGAFNLAYNAGDEAELGKELAIELIDKGYAVPVKDSEIRTAEAKLKAEKRRK